MSALARAAILAAAAVPLAVGAPPAEGTCQAEMCQADLDLESASLLQRHGQPANADNNLVAPENLVAPAIPMNHSSLATAVGDKGHLPPKPPMPCLCTFDVDRTLTAKQGAATVNKCKPRFPGLEYLPGIKDPAFGGGDLTLSQVGRGFGETFCKWCYIGVVTAGNAGGTNSDMRAKLVNKLKAFGDDKVPTKWFDGPLGGKGASADDCKKLTSVSSTLVAGCNDGTKQYAVMKILEFLKTKKKVSIPPQNAWHFDDNKDNIDSYARFYKDTKGAFPLNVRQISCGSRDKSKKGTIGWCGAATSEIVMNPDKNPFYCKGGGQIWPDPQ